jgi:hypothetical protein
MIREEGESTRQVEKLEDKLSDGREDSLEKVKSCKNRVKNNARHEKV